MSRTLEAYPNSTLLVDGDAADAGKHYLLDFRSKSTFSIHSLQVENKNAALSKAFLAYQVEQLERSLPASNKHGRHQSHPPRHEIDQKHNQPTKRIKDADVVVASAGVLLHAPSRVQRWCHPQSKEIVCIPLSGKFE